MELSWSEKKILNRFVEIQDEPLKYGQRMLTPCSAYTKTAKEFGVPVSTVQSIVCSAFNFDGDYREHLFKNNGG